MSRRRRRSSRGRRVALLALAALAIAGLWLTRTPHEWLRLPRWPRDQAARISRASRPERPRSTQPQTGSSITTPVYFVRMTDRQVTLVPVPRQVPARSPARGALQELISGPVPPGCRRPLPEGTRLRAVRVKGGIATADFTKEICSKFPGGSSSEGALVYSIVNTLTTLPGVEKAQILVEGQQVETIGGHLDVRNPLAYDGELLAQ